MDEVLARRPVDVDADVEVKTSFLRASRPTSEQKQSNRVRKRVEQRLDLASEKNGRSESGKKGVEQRLDLASEKRVEPRPKKKQHLDLASQKKSNHAET